MSTNNDALMTRTKSSGGIRQIIIMSGVLILAAVVLGGSIQLLKFMPPGKNQNAYEILSECFQKLLSVLGSTNQGD